MDTVESAVTQTVVAASKAVAPKFDNLMNVEFTYKEGGAWHTVEINAHEFLKVLQTAEFEGRNVCAVSVCEVNTDLEDGSVDKVRFIYDFLLLHTERNPWRIA